jgi:hypothetical protein
MNQYDVVISAGPCQFCDWTPGKGTTPSYAYDPDNPKDVLLACPKCGFELLGQSKIDKDEDA